MISFDGLDREEALHVARRMMEAAARRGRLRVIRDHEVKAQYRELWEAYETAFPPEAGWARPKPEVLDREQEQIERIGFTIWEMFHARHGGEFSPTGSIAADMTMQAADRAWAIAQEPVKMTLPLMSALMGDLDEHAHAGRWEYLSEVYAALEPTRMSTEEIVVYLRHLYAARDKITSYRDFLNRSQTALARRGERSTVLRGLDD